MRKFTFIALLCMLHISGYAQESFASAPYSDIISKYRHLSQHQLFDTANYYFNKNNTDTALICYSLIINKPVMDTEQQQTEQQQREIDALNKSAIIYYGMCNYRKSFELLMKALDCCETYRLGESRFKIHANIGNIYSRFNRRDMAESCYAKSLSLCGRSADSIAVLNNLGVIKRDKGQLDSAFYLLNRSLQISRLHNDLYMHVVLHTIASVYQKNGSYDSAFHYSRISLAKAEKGHEILRFKAEVLSDMSKLFFEVDQIDSARLYIRMSNILAEKNGFLETLADNSLTLSKIEESQGRTASAFQYYKEYAAMKDSVLNTEILGDINSLQRLYEMSKINRRIEQLAVEKYVNERTIRYQQLITAVIAAILAVVTAILFMVAMQKRKLNRAYLTLFDKNIEIIALQNNATANLSEKYARRAISSVAQQELLNKILILMEDASVFCSADFSLGRLAELTQSNQSYVSQIINEVLNRNFRTFLNSYRIREAQRIFSEPDAQKYTIESIAFRVGFRSSSTFRAAFREITGVSPAFYLKSMKEKAGSIIN